MGAACCTNVPRATVPVRVASVEASVATAPRAATAEELVDKAWSRDASEGTSTSASSRSSAAKGHAARLVGQWRSRYGIFSIGISEQGELRFEEGELFGVLRFDSDGEWYDATIRDGAQEGAVHGYLRIRLDKKGLTSTFKKTLEKSFEEVGSVSSRMLPYLRLSKAYGSCALGSGCSHAGQGEEASCHFDQSTCCICMEKFGPGEELAELKCHHVFHKECIHDWFVRNGSCPMRCSCE